MKSEPRKGTGMTNQDQGDERVKQNRIGLAKQLEGVAWLKEHRDEARRVPQTELAARLAGVLGCMVTVGNLVTMAKAAKVTLHGYVGEMALVDRLARLEARVQDLEDALAAARPVPGGCEVGLVERTERD